MNTHQPSHEPPGSSQPEKEALSQESFHTLKILDEVAKGKPLTQRDLSKKLGIALGMTNSYLKRLASKGYIQITQAERKRLHYLLTPKGIAEKSALTYRYIKRSYRVFTEIRERMKRFFNDLEKEGAKSVVLYKATVITEIAILSLLDTQLQLVAIVDDDMTGERFLGRKVEPVKALSDLVFDRILITTEEPAEKIAGYLCNHGVAREKVCSL